MIEYEDFSETLNNLICLNRQNRAGSESRLIFSPQQWAAEFCTVSCNIGRQTGKTRFIKDHAGREDVIIVPNHYMKRWYASTGNTKAKIMTVAELILEQIERRQDMAFDTIYVDEPRHLFSEIPHNLFYDLMTKGYGQTFIFLGAQ